MTSHIHNQATCGQRKLSLIKALQGPQALSMPMRREVYQGRWQVATVEESVPEKVGGEQTEAAPGATQTPRRRRALGACCRLKSQRAPSLPLWSSAAADHRGSLQGPRQTIKIGRARGGISTQVTDVELCNSRPLGRTAGAQAGGRQRTKGVESTPPVVQKGVPLTNCCHLLLVELYALRPPASTGHWPLLAPVGPRPTRKGTRWVCFGQQE